MNWKECSRRGPHRGEGCASPQGLVSYNSPLTRWVTTEGRPLTALGGSPQPRPVPGAVLGWIHTTPPLPPCLHLAPPCISSLPPLTPRHQCLDWGPPQSRTTSLKTFTFITLAKTLCAQRAHSQVPGGHILGGYPCSHHSMWAAWTDNNPPGHQEQGGGSILPM